MIGVGRVGYLVFLSALCSMAYLGISVLFVFLYGMDGIGIALVSITLINQIFSFPYVCKFLGISPFRHFLQCQFFPAIGGIFLVIFIYFMAGIFGDDSYFKLVFVVIAGFVFYGVYCYNVVLLCHERYYIKNKFTFDFY